MTTATFEKEMGLLEELTKRVERLGLFKPDYPYYVRDVIMSLSFVAIIMLAISRGPEATIWFMSSAIASYMFLPAVSAAVKTRLAYVAHDAGHNEVFPQDEKKNTYVLAALTFVLGISGIWWKDTHNAHHAHPNHVKLDPNLRVWFLAFSDSQRELMGHVRRFFVRFQFLYYPLLVAFEILAMRIYSIFQISTRSYPTWWIEAVGMVFYFTTHVGFLWYFLGGWQQAVIFLVVQEVALGLILGSVFASNHKGMRVIEDGEEVSFLEEQLTTTRNVKPGFATDYAMGGLNYQTEHHLFPMVTRSKLKRLRKVVRRFCSENGLFYYEVSYPRSLWEIVRAFFCSGNGRQKTVDYVWEADAA